MTDEDIRARVLHEDGMILVIDKPAGLAVHAGPKGGETLEDRLGALRLGWPRDPAPAHRLDRDTSGCLVLGRHSKALRRLGKAFSQGRVGKTYWAVVRGGPEQEAGTIDAPLAKRSTERRGWWMTVDRDAGKVSVTDWRVLGRGGGLAWLELSPRTGRTHQIRVHCAHMGWPVLGDPVYGGSKNPAAPLHLHARAVAVPALSSNKPPVTVVAPVPDHMHAALAACGWRPNVCTGDSQ